MFVDSFITATRALNILKIGQLSLSSGNCPLCGKTLFVKLRDNDALAIRCLRCKGSLASLGIAYALKARVPDFQNKKIYEISSRGPFFNFLKRNCCDLTYSEYFDDTKPGAFKGKVQCQDVQNLTFKDESFDVCTSTEVFEHVPDDIKGFKEIYRILKAKGVFLFTVPLNIKMKTIERAVFKRDAAEHIMAPEYHDDRIRGIKTVLCYRNYGYDITEKLLTAGFRRYEIIEYKPDFKWDTKRALIIGYK